MLGSKIPKKLESEYLYENETYNLARMIITDLASIIY